MKAHNNSDVTRVFFDENLTEVKRTFSVIHISTKEIANCVTRKSRLLEPGFFSLEKDIIANGMKNPIIITKNTKAAYHHAIVNVNKSYISPYDAEKAYLCLFGNQRLTIAERNGITSIDCIEVETPIEAIFLMYYYASLK